METLRQSPLLEKWNIDELRYSFVWEDIACLQAAIADRRETTLGRVLSIGSSGDNAFGLLVNDPEEVVIIDLSPSQMALVELKKVAIEALSHPEFLELFASKPGTRGRELYRQIRHRLSNDGRQYWDYREERIENGLHDQGRLDRYFKKFREQGLPRLWSEEDLLAMTQAATLSDQLKSWSKANPEKLKALASDFFSKTALSLEGRHSSQFAYVEQENIGPIFLRNFVRLIQSQRIAENPYLTYFLTGGALEADGTIPLWSAAQFAVIKERIGRVKLVTRDLESYLAGETGRFDLMNLSDLFEYLSDEGTQALFRALEARLSTNGRICYWTLLVEREPKSTGLEIDRVLSREISAKDRTWFYSGFHVAKKSGAVGRDQ